MGVDNDHVTSPEPEGGNGRWKTPTGEPCPRAQRVDGRIDGGGDCHGCGFCLLLAGLVDSWLIEKVPSPDETRGT